MLIKVFISLGSVIKAPSSIFTRAEARFTYAFKRKDGMVFIGHVLAPDRKNAERNIRRKHLLEFAEMAGNDIPVLKTTFEIKEIARCGKC